MVPPLPSMSLSCLLLLFVMLFFFDTHAEIPFLTLQVLADGEPQIKCVCGNFGGEEWMNQHLSHPNNQKAGEHGLTDKKAN